MTTSLVVIALILVAVWLVLRLRQGATTQGAKVERRVSEPSTEYHAVSIRLPKSACAAAKELAGRRFLSSAAPSLPLAECDALECNCHYAHHDDRRESEDRRDPYGVASFGGAVAQTGDDRRKHKERRDERDEEEF